MAAFPLPPSLACVLLHARKDDLPPSYLGDLCAIVAMLVSEDPYIRPSNPGALERAEAQRQVVSPPASTCVHAHIAYVCLPAAAPRWTR